jgi:dimethylargininase
MTRVALVREVPSSFARALSAVPPDPPIDVARARAQHAAYVAALAQLGVGVRRLPADDAWPDACFIEDCAVIAGGVAVITRPGAPSRRGETDAVAAALAKLLPCATIDEPATLDGGDCLRLGARVYVGRSARSNDDGIAQLAEVLGPRGVTVIPVPMPPGMLHLKTVCSPLDDTRVLLAEGTIPAADLPGAVPVFVPAAETAAANCVAVGDAALVAAGFPAARAAVERAGLRAIEVDTSELRKADGALTCLSIVV